MCLPPSQELPLNRSSHKSIGRGATGPGVPVPAQSCMSPDKAFYGPRPLMSSDVMLKGDGCSICAHPPLMNNWTHRSIEPSLLVHGQVPPGEEPFDGHNTHLHCCYLQDTWEESGRPITPSTSHRAQR